MEGVKILTVFMLGSLFVLSILLLFLSKLQVHGSLSSRGDIHYFFKSASYLFAGACTFGVVREGNYQGLPVGDSGMGIFQERLVGGSLACVLGGVRERDYQGLLVGASEAGIFQGRRVGGSLACTFAGVRERDYQGLLLGDSKIFRFQGGGVGGVRSRAIGGAGGGGIRGLSAGDSKVVIFQGRSVGGVRARLPRFGGKRAKGNRIEHVSFIIFNNQTIDYGKGQQS
jgi:hypothetical protein